MIINTVGTSELEQSEIHLSQKWSEKAKNARMRNEIDLNEYVIDTFSKRTEIDLSWINLIMWIASTFRNSDQRWRISPTIHNERETIYTDFYFYKSCHPPHVKRAMHIVKPWD